jgi:hypothetical protein
MSDSEDEESSVRRAGAQGLFLAAAQFAFSAAAAQKVVRAAAPAAPATAQVVVGAAAPAAPAAAQVVVRKRPSSEVDIDDAPEPMRQRFGLTMSSAQFLPAMQAMQAQRKSDLENVAEQLALEERKLALDKARLEFKAKEFELRKKQEEWEIERKEKMAVADRKCKQHSWASAFDKI